MTLLQRAALIGVIGLASWGAHASDGDFVWARSMGGPEFDGGNGIALDGAGNVYTTGYFEGTVDFDPGEGTFNLTSAGNDDIFVQTLDASGNLVWARRFGGTRYDRGDAIAVDGLGNVYLLSSQFGGPDMLVQKLDTNGELLWARSIELGDSGNGYAIALDGAGNVYATGSFGNTVDFDPGAGTYNLTSAGERDIFVQKLDANGSFVWARSMGGISYEIGFGIVVDGRGNVYTTGWFQGMADFDPGEATFNLTSAGQPDAFVQKLDANGNFVWARRMGWTRLFFENGTSTAFGKAIAIDASNNVYTTGHFEGRVDFNPGAGNFNLFSTEDSYDIFVQKLDANGNFVWARRMGGAGDDYGRGIAIDGRGNVYTTGYFWDTADFDPGPGTVNLTSAGLTDIFLQKLDNDGTFDWALRLGGMKFDVAAAIAVDSSGFVYTTGRFEDRVNFDPGTDTSNLTSAGQYDIFVLSHGPDVTPPNVTTIVPDLFGPTNADSVGFTVTFDEDVQNFDGATDLVLNHIGTASTGASISGGPSVYAVTINGITGDGSFALAVSTKSDVQDLKGNSLASSVVSAPVTIDNTPPAASIAGPTGSPVNRRGTAAYLVAVTGANRINLTSGDVTVNHSGTAGGSVVVIDGTSETPVIEVSGVTGEGSYSISVSAGIASDAAGNSSEATGPGNAVTVDNTPPAFTNIASIPPEVEAGNPVLLTFDSTEPLSGDPEVTVNGNPAMLFRKTAYGYTYVALESDAPGPARIEIQGMDIAGNLGSATDTTALSIVEPTPEGEGDVEGSVEGAVEGMPEGAAEGAVEGGEEGAIEGSLEGQEEGEEEGTTEGSAEGLDEGEAEGSAEGAVEGSIEGMIEGEPEGAIEGSEEGSMDGEGEGEPGGGLLSCRCNAFGPSPSLGEILGQLFLGAVTLMALLMMTVYQKRFW